MGPSPLTRPGFPRTSVRWGPVEHTGQVPASAKRLHDRDRARSPSESPGESRDQCRMQHAPTAPKLGLLACAAGQPQLPPPTAYGLPPRPPHPATHATTPDVTSATLPRRPQLVTQRPWELATLGAKGR